MTNLAKTISGAFRDWLDRGEPGAAPPAGDALAQAEVEAHLATRRADMCHWLFLVRTGLALGLAGFFAFNALATPEVLNAGALGLALGYAAANVAVRFGGGRHLRAAPWAYAAADFVVVVLLYVFSGTLLGVALAPSVMLVGLLVLQLLVYTLLGNPALNAALSLAALTVVGGMFYAVPGLAPTSALGALDAADSSMRSFLLVEYLSVACLVTCLVALRLRQRLVAYSTELHRRLKATVEASLEEDRRRHLEAVGQLKRDFIAVLSHELRNPVAPLVSALDVVQSDARAGQCDPEMVGVAVDAARELHQLVSDYTQLAALLTRDLEEATRQNVPLGPLAEATAAHLEEHAAGDGPADLTGALPAPSPFAFEAFEEAHAVASDPPLVHATMHALMRRALHHTAPDGMVTVRGHREQGAVGFAIHDPDSCLDPGAMAALDDLFAPTEERLYAQDATGLELLLARHALQRVGGRLRVKSSPGEGTTVYCLFPAASPQHSSVSEAHVRALPAEQSDQQLRRHARA